MFEGELKLKLSVLHEPLVVAIQIAKDAKARSEQSHRVSLLPLFEAR